MLLEKDIKLDLINFVFPKNLSEGEVVELNFIVKNKGDKLINTELELKSLSGELFDSINFNPQTLTLSPNQEKEVSFSAKIKDKLKVNFLSKFPIKNN